MRQRLISRMILALGALVMLAVLDPWAYCAQGDWTRQLNTWPGNSFGSHYDYSSVPPYTCFSTPNLQPADSCAGAQADWHGCSGESEAFLSGIVCATLKWTGSGTMPTRICVHMTTLCGWAAHDDGQQVPSGASAVLNSSFADTRLPLGGTGTVGESLTGERRFWADVNPDGTVTAAISVRADVTIPGNATQSGYLSVSAGIIHFDEELNPPPPPANVSAAWKASSLSYHPVHPQHHPINGGAKTGGDPVNLASGKHEYLPDPDITVYNPYGPAVIYLRNFEGLRADTGYSSPGLSAGWVDTYDLMLATSGTGWPAPKLTYPNGAQETLTPILNGDLPTGEFTEPTGAPYFATGEPSGTTGLWNWIKVTWKDGAVWTFTPAETDKYRLTRIAGRTGSYINIVRDPAKSYRVTSVAGPADTLLTFAYDGEDRLSSATDIYGRKVVYTFGAVGNSTCLTSVSRIGVGAGTPPAHYTYGYTLFGSSPQYPHLSSVTFPSPSGSGTSQQLVNYDTAANRVTSLVDANGNTTEFTYQYDNGTCVTVKNAQSVEEKTWIESFDPAKGYVSTGVTDAAGNCTYMAFEDAANPTRPTQIYDKNGSRTTITYDQYGNVHTMQRPRGTVTTYSYDYNAFRLGRLTSIQEGAKTPTTFVHYEPSGLVQTITSPKPGTTDGSTVITSFTYDALGNVLTKTIPASSDTGTMTTTYNYTTDGEYTQPAKIGQPLTVTDNLGHATHYRYDARGNVISAKDSLANETNYTYNIADQPVSIISPAVSQ